jgi:ketosteroid isomerase-like protein
LEHYGRQLEGEEEEMTLRATQIYRREHGEWKVIHCHGYVLHPSKRNGEGIWRRLI